MYSDSEQKIFSEKSRKTLATKMLDWYLYTEVRLKWKRFSVSIHRVVASVYLGLDLFDTDTCVLHRNDIRNCNNISNLFLWTKKDNYDDMVNKWRRVIPIRTWQFKSNKLKDSDVASIKKFISQWIPQSKIAKMFWICQQTVSSINTWKNWALWSIKHNIYDAPKQL